MGLGGGPVRRGGPHLKQTTVPGAHAHLIRWDPSLFEVWMRERVTHGGADCSSGRSWNCR